MGSRKPLDLHFKIRVFVWLLALFVANFVLFGGRGQSFKGETLLEASVYSGSYQGMAVRHWTDKYSSFEASGKPGTGQWGAVSLISDGLVEGTISDQELAEQLNRLYPKLKNEDLTIKIYVIEKGQKVLDVDRIVTKRRKRGSRFRKTTIDYRYNLQLPPKEDHHVVTMTTAQMRDLLGSSPSLDLLKIDAIPYGIMTLIIIWPLFGLVKGRLKRGYWGVTDSEIVKIMITKEGEGITFTSVSVKYDHQTDLYLKILIPSKQMRKFEHLHDVYYKESSDEELIEALDRALPHLKTMDADIELSFSRGESRNWEDDPDLSFDTDVLRHYLN